MTDKQRQIFWAATQMRAAQKCSVGCNPDSYCDWCVRVAESLYDATLERIKD